MTIAEAFENFGLETSCGDPPPQLIETAKHRILNLLGVKLPGDY